MVRCRSWFAALLAAFGTVTLVAGPAARFEEAKRAASPAELYALLYALPKGGDLHNHFGGSSRAEWWRHAALRAAARGAIFYTPTRLPEEPTDDRPAVRFQTISAEAWAELPAEARGDWSRFDTLPPDLADEWLARIRLDRPEEGRDEFFDRVWTRIGALRGDLGINLEVMLRNLQAFGAEGVRYVEWQWGARNQRDTDGRLLAPEETVARVRAFLGSPAARATGVTVRFQEAVLRHHPLAERQMIEAHAFVTAHRDLWVGLNLAGLEERPGGQPARFLETFRALRRRGPAVPLALHAGEMDGPDRHVRDSLLLGATRIGHGVYLIHDPETLLLLRAGMALVEIQLISNRLLGYVPDPAAHPFPEYLRTGIPVCLNTDDRGIWDSNLTDEYYAAVTTFDLTWDELVRLWRDSLRHAFVEAPEKARLLADHERAVEESGARLADARDWRDVLAGVRPVAYGYAVRTWGLSLPE